MADRYELAFVKNALSVTSTDPQEQTALVNLLFQRLLTGNFKIDASGVVTFAFTGLFGDGTVGAPAISFTNEPTSGRYRIGTNNIGEAIGGTLVLDWSGARLNLGALHLIWTTDNTKDIGASGANRPRDLFLGRNAVIGGALTLGTVLASAQGGTGSAFFAISGPSALRTFAFPDASATILTTNTAVTVAQGGTSLASGTSGGVLGYTGTTTLASSALLPSGYTVIGGGAGATPTAVATGAPISFALTDGATPALDASLGTEFTLAAGGDRTIAVPTNPTRGQKIIIRHLASGGARTLALNTGAGGFRFGSDIPALSQTASGKYDYIGCVYNTDATFWDVVAVTKGF